MLLACFSKSVNGAEPVKNDEKICSREVLEARKEWDTERRALWGKDAGTPPWYLNDVTPSPGGYKLIPKSSCVAPNEQEKKN